MGRKTTFTLFHGSSQDERQVRRSVVVARVVRRGGPVRLNFYRDETASCSDQIVFGIARDLPAYKGESGRVHLNLRHADDARQTYRGSE